MYQEWLSLPPQLMTVKEAVLLLQRLAYVQDRFDGDPIVSNKWHNLFLDIVYGICTSTTLPQVRDTTVPTQSAFVAQILLPAQGFCTLWNSSCLAYHADMILP